MPIIVRQSDAVLPQSWSGDDVVGDDPGLAEDLLPLVGWSAQAPASAPDRALALDALLVLRITRDRPGDAGSWGEPAFAREVDRIRRDLVPIVSRQGLAASFAREANLTAGVRLAYALRWVELDLDEAGLPWTRLVAKRD